MTEHKTLFSGTTRAGKTTVWRGQLNTTPVNRCSQHRRIGRQRLDDGRTGYGKRSWTTAKSCVVMAPLATSFDFMWKISSLGALGLIILIDKRRPDPLADRDI